MLFASSAPLEYKQDSVQLYVRKLNDTTIPINPTDCCDSLFLHFFTNIVHLVLPEVTLQTNHVIGTSSQTNCLIKGKNVALISLQLTNPYGEHLLNKPIWDEFVGLSETGIRIFSQKSPKQLIQQAYQSYKDSTQNEELSLLKYKLFTSVLLHSPHTSHTLSLNTNPEPPGLTALPIDRKTSDLIKLQHIYHTYIESFDNNIPTIKDISQKIGMSGSKFSKLFIQLYGQSYYQCHMNKKMEKAQQLLQMGCKVKEVSAFLGYSQPTKFLIAFKNKFNETPHRYKVQGQSE